MARKTIKQMREEEEEIISQVSKKTEIERVLPKKRNWETRKFLPKC